MILKYKTLSPEAEALNKEALLLRRGTDQAAGMDMFVTESAILAPGETKLFKTGIALEIPTGCFGLIHTRSSAYKRGIHTAGVIDSDYRGEVHLVVTNLGRQAQHIEAGKAYGQMILLEYQKLILVEAKDLQETKRGQGGYGSTGHS